MALTAEARAPELGKGRERSRRRIGHSCRGMVVVVMMTMMIKEV